MAGQRACRHDMRRPRYGSNRMPKDGRSRGRQTYRCEDCKYRCAPDVNRHRYSSKVIEQTLAMYAEGASAAAIGGAMKINEASALVWVKKSPFVHPDNGRGAFGTQARRVGTSRVGEEDTRTRPKRRRFHSMRCERTWEFGEGRSGGRRGSGRRWLRSGRAAGGRTSRLDAGTRRRSFGCFGGCRRRRNAGATAMRRTASRL